MGNYPRRLYDPLASDIVFGDYRETAFFYDDPYSDYVYAILTKSNDTPDTFPRLVAKYSKLTGTPVATRLLDYYGILNPGPDYLDVASPIIRPPNSNKLYTLFSMSTFLNATDETTWFVELNENDLSFSKKSLTPKDMGYAGGGLCFPGIGISPPGVWQGQAACMCANDGGTYIVARGDFDNFAVWDTVGNNVLYTDFRAMGYTGIVCGAVEQVPQFWCFDKSGDLWALVIPVPANGTFQMRLDRWRISAGPVLTLIDSFPVAPPLSPLEGIRGEGLSYNPSTDELEIWYSVAVVGVGFVPRYMKWQAEFHYETLAPVDLTPVGLIIGDTWIGGSSCSEFPQITVGNWSSDRYTVGVQRKPFPASPGWGGFHRIDKLTGNVTTFDLSLWPTDPINPVANRNGGTQIWINSTNEIWIARLEASGPPFSTYGEGFGIYGFPSPSSGVPFVDRVIAYLPNPRYWLGPRGGFLIPKRFRRK